MAMTIDRATEFMRLVDNGQISGRISEWPGLREACGAIYAHLTQPAQAVDVGAIREVIAEMREFEDYPALIRLRKAADKLTRAIAVASDGWSVPDDVMKDAARYQWLRISANISWNEWVTYENLMASDRERDEMDAAIDRAIAITYAPTPPTDGEE